MTPLILSLLGSFTVALISVIGIITFSLSEKLLNKILIFFVSFSAGALIGGAFFHLLPEAIDINKDPAKVFAYSLTGFCLFFLIERILRWHHCHKFDCDTHRHLGFLNLIGDGVHNFLDGIIIISAFSVNAALGIPITVSIILHEVPQELSDYGVLLHSGFTKTRALFYNFMAAAIAIIGVIAGYLLLDSIQNINQYLIPFAAGNFIYIGASDLIPEIHQERNAVKSLFSFLIFLSALFFMFWLKSFSKL